MAIQIADSFGLKARKFLDNRQTFDTIQAMVSFAESSLPNGFITYNKEDGKRYEFNSTNEVDSVLGKWREFTVGDTGSSKILDWEFKKAYKSQDICLYNNMFYRCVNDIAESLTDPSYDIANWKLIGGGASSSSSIKFLGFTPNYSYSYGDVIRHNEILYCAKRSFEATDTFDINDWELVTGDLKSTILDLDNDGIIDLSKRALIADIAKESELLMTWKPNTFYEISQQVLYLNKIYTVVQDHTSPSVFDENDPNLQLIATGSHNNLLTLQGGKENEYYHLTKDSYDTVSQLSIDVNNNLLFNSQNVGDMTIERYDTNNDGIVNKAHTLDGLTASIEQLNYVQGAKSNLQGQIDSITSIANFTHTMPTKADMLLITNAKEKDMVIVSADEDNGGKTTVYVYNGTAFEYVCDFNAEIRDFTINPLDIVGESIGILPDDRIPDTVARKTDIVQLDNADLLATYDQTNNNIKDAVTKKHTHNNLDILNGYNQTNEDLTKAVKHMHTHENISILNNFSEDADQKPYYRGKLLGGGSGGGISDLSTFTTADLNDSLNRRYVTDTDKANLGNLTGIITDQSKINTSLTSIKESIPTDVSNTNQLVSSDKLKTTIEAIKFKELADVDKNVQGKAFVVTDEKGDITFKQDIGELMNIKQITDKNGNVFSEVPSVSFSNLKGTQDDVTEELTLELDNIFTTNLSDMPTEYIDGGVLVSNADTQKYELKDISDLVDCTENFSLEVVSTEWGLNDNFGKYTKVINHNLNSQNLIISFYDTENISVDIKWQILDISNVLLISDNALDGRVVINCSQGTTGDGSGASGSGSSTVIKSTDFIDNTRARDDKTYSSNYLVNMLQTDYAQKSNVFTKTQANARFSLKELEHIHTNETTINKFSEDINGQLYYGNKMVMTEITAYTYQKVFVQESHPISLDLILDVNEVFTNNNYKAIINTEFTIRNNIEKTGTEEDDKADNQLHLVVVDNTLTVLDVYIKPSDTQKYILGISPNVKIMAQLPNGTFDATYYMTTY